MSPPASSEERAREIAMSQGRRDAEKSLRAMARSTARPETQTARIRQAMAEEHIKRYAQAEEDAADENALPGGIRLTVGWLAGQIVRAFANAGLEPTVDPRYLAWQISGLHDEELGSDVCQLDPARIDPNRVVGHIEQLGVRLPNRVTGTIARRIFLAIKNRDVPLLPEPPAAAAPPEPVGTEYCVECCTKFRKGDTCACP